MAIYEIQAPDGSVFEIEGPENASDADLLAFAEQQWGAASAPEAPSMPPEPAEERSAMDRFMTGASTGLKERGLGILQLGLEATGNADTDLYDSTLDLARQYNKEQEQGAGGVAGFMGELVGDPLTYAPLGAAAKMGQGVKFASKEGAKHLSKMGAATGVTYGGLQTVEDEDDNRLENSLTTGATGAIAGPLLGSAVPKVAQSAASGVKHLSKGIAPRALDALNDTAAALQKKGSDSFTRMREQGMLFSQPKSKNIVTNLRPAVTDGLKLTKGVHSGTLRVMKDFEKDLLTKRNIGIDDLYAWRKNFSAVARSKSPEKAEDAMAASRAINYIDEALDKTMPIDVMGGNTRAVGLLKQGKKEWSQYKKFEKIVDIVDKAEGRADKIQKGAKKLMDSKQFKGYTAEEQQVIKEMARSGMSDKTLEFLSRFGVSRGGVSLGGVSAAGLAVAAENAPLAAGVLATGTAARVLRNGLERGKAEKLLKIIESGGRIPEKEALKLPTQVGKFLMDSGLVAKAGGKALEE